MSSKSSTLAGSLRWPKYGICQCCTCGPSCRRARSISSLQGKSLLVRTVTRCSTVVKTGISKSLIYKVKPRPPRATASWTPEVASAVNRSDVKTTSIVGAVDHRARVQLTVKCRPRGDIWSLPLSHLAQQVQASDLYSGVRIIRDRKPIASESRPFHRLASNPTRRRCFIPPRLNFHESIAKPGPKRIKTPCCRRNVAGLRLDAVAFGHSPVHARRGSVAPNHAIDSRAGRRIDAECDAPVGMGPR